jgi:hypothetical protein
MAQELRDQERKLPSGCWPELDFESEGSKISRLFHMTGREDPAEDAEEEYRTLILSQAFPADLTLL